MLLQVIETTEGGRRSPASHWSAAQRSQKKRFSPHMRACEMTSKAVALSAICAGAAFSCCDEGGGCSFFPLAELAAGGVAADGDAGGLKLEEMHVLHTAWGGQKSQQQMPTQDSNRPAQQQE